MGQFPYPLQCLVVAVAGGINQQRRDVIAYLQEENRVLREQLSPRRLRFTDAQRRRLAANARTLGRRAQVAGITAEPDGAWVTQLTRNATDAVVDRRD